MPQMMPLGWAWMILSLVLVYFMFMVIFYFLMDVGVEYSLSGYDWTSEGWEW